MNRKRVILTSCSIILLCTAIIVGFTFALFTEEVTLKNHLQAGELSIKLYRTELKYMNITAEGHLKEELNSEAQDYSPGSPANDTNVFGLDSSAVKMVPGSWRQATMGLVSTAENDVAFDYEVKIKLSGDVNEFAKQLYVTVTDNKGDTVVEEKQLSSFASDEGGFTVITDTMEATGKETTHTFTVKIEFADADNNNDVSKDMNATFDLFVVATQRTDAPKVEQTTESSTEASTAANE